VAPDSAFLMNFFNPVQISSNNNFFTTSADFSQPSEQLVEAWIINLGIELAQYRASHLAVKRVPG